MKLVLATARAIALASLLVIPPCATAAGQEAEADTSLEASRTLMDQLAAFMRARGTDAENLTAGSMVGLMLDWYRFDAAAGPADVLVYRYGGWSEGCATGFRFSVLRRVAMAGGGNGDAVRVAGITMMFEPSSRSELAPYATTSSDWKSLEAFLSAIEGSPAFREISTATPMSVMVETGGVR